MAGGLLGRNYSINEIKVESKLASLSITKPAYYSINEIKVESKQNLAELN